MQPPEGLQRDVEGSGLSSGEANAVAYSLAVGVKAPKLDGQDAPAVLGRVAHVQVSERQSPRERLALARVHREPARRDRRQFGRTGRVSRSAASGDDRLPAV